MLWKYSVSWCFRTSRGVGSRWLMSGALSAALFLPAALGAQDAAQQGVKDPLPDAPGKDLVLQKCTQCHDESRFAVLHQSGDDWDQVLTQMTTNGLTVTDEEYATILNYLAKNLGPLPAKVNVNTASADDLQKGLQLTSDEAAAIVKFRGSHPPFKTWQDVAAVDGVDAKDAKKIEAKKDLLVF
jgi:competence ComEA-like helix-hairpin-helix protein